MASRLVRANVVTVGDVLDRHTLLRIDCVDRVYLTLPVPSLVVGGQVVSFLTAHEKNPIPSPALPERRGQAFRRAVASFAGASSIPVLSFTGKRDKARPGMLAGSPWPERKTGQVMPLMRAKRQAARAGLSFRELSSGFASCEDPAALQDICGRLGPGRIRVFAGRWRARLPLPFTRAGRPAGYRREISMRQVEVASTTTFTAPRHARTFSGVLAAGNLDTGRPDTMEIIFSRQVRSTAKGVFRTAAGRDNDGVVINAFCRHSRVKAYLKDGRALRTGTVINDACDIGVLRRTGHFDELTAKARDVSRRMLQTMRAGQDCVLASPAIERAAQPTLTEDGRRAPALRSGEPRVMALAGALSLALAGTCGFTSKSLRALTARLPGTPYSASQTTYDLRRLRLNGLIRGPGTLTPMS